MKNICPVCAYDELTEPAYDEDGNGSFEICPQCGFQFGNDDFPDKVKAIAAWLKKWQLAGKPYFSTKKTSK